MQQSMKFPHVIYGDVKNTGLPFLAVLTIIKCLYRYSTRKLKAMWAALWETRCQSELNILTVQIFVICLSICRLAVTLQVS